VKIDFVVFWVVVPCNVVVGYHLFGGLKYFSSALKMEATWSSDTLVSTHHTTWHDNPENHEFQAHNRFSDSCSVSCMWLSDE